MTTTAEYTSSLRLRECPSLLSNDEAEVEKDASK